MEEGSLEAAVGGVYDVDARGVGSGAQMVAVGCNEMFSGGIGNLLSQPSRMETMDTRMGPTDRGTDRGTGRPADGGDGGDGDDRFMHWPTDRGTDR